MKINNFSRFLLSFLLIGLVGYVPSGMGMHGQGGGPGDFFQQAVNQASNQIQASLQTGLSKLTEQHQAALGKLAEQQQKLFDLGTAQTAATTEAQKQNTEALKAVAAEREKVLKEFATGLGEVGKEAIKQHKEFLAASDVAQKEALKKQMEGILEALKKNPAFAPIVEQLQKSTGYFKKDDKGDEIFVPYAGEQTNLIKQYVDAEAKKQSAMVKLLQAGTHLTQDVGEMVQPKNWPLLAGLAIAGYFAKKSVDFTFHHAKLLMNRPTLIKRTNRVTWVDKLDKMLGRTKKLTEEEEAEEKRETSSIIVSPELEPRLAKIFDQVKKSVELDEPLSSILLYGPPGTGKTLFATLLALRSGMYYAIIATPQFREFVHEGDVSGAVSEMKKIFEWAATSELPIVFVFDEADDIFTRKTSPRSDLISRTLTNLFLNYVNKPSSKKFMFVFATNHPEDLDETIISRIGHNKLMFKLPELPERIKILTYYLTENIRKSGLTIDKALSDNLTPVAEKLKGFAPREIEETTLEMRREMRYRKNKTLTTELANRLIDEAISEKKNREEYIQGLQQKEREMQKGFGKTVIEGG